MILSVKVKQGLFRFAEIIHLRIFGYEMGDEMRRFLGNLSWSFFGGLIGAGVLFGINIIFGRIFGPEEYGRYSLIVALSGIFTVFMTMGSETAVVHYVAKDEKQEPGRYITSAFIIWIVATSLWGALFFFLSIYLPSFFQQGIAEVALTAIFFAIVLSGKTVMDGCIRGLQLFQFQSLIRMIEVAIVLLVFFLGIFFLGGKIGGVWLYIGSLSCGLILASLFFLRKISVFFSWIYWWDIKKMLLYGMYALLGSLSGIFLNSFDKLIIADSLGNESLGIYNAYFSASLLLVGQLMAVFVNVFFPTLSRMNQGEGLLKKLNCLSKKMFPIMFIGLFVFISIAIYLFGNEYPFDFFLLLEFSLLGCLTAYFYALWWLIAAKSHSGIQFTSFHGIIGGLVFVFPAFFFGAHIGLRGVVLLLILSLTYNIVIGNIRYGHIKE